MKKKLKYAKFTAEQIQNIEESWDIIEPMRWSINIYDNYETYLKTAEAFTLEQRYLSAIHWYFAEVDNGGHHQFFDNSTGIVWEDALNGFRHFGMIQQATNLQKVVDYFGGVISFDREERWDMLEMFREKDEDAFFELLDKADKFVYNNQELESELDYIKSHPEKFVFEGEYWGYGF